MEEQLNPLAVTHLLQHTLRSLCNHKSSQWIYAVFWRILPRNYPPPKWDLHGGVYDRSRGNRRNWILAWEDGFCNFAASSCEQAMTEEECQLKGLQPELFFKMSHEIYNYGEGLIGKVAADHSHKWVFKEPQDHKMVLLSTWNNPADSVTTEDLGGSVPIWHRDHCSGCCQGRRCTVGFRQQGDGGLELGHSTTQEVRLPRKYTRRPPTAPVVVGVPDEDRSLHTPSELARLPAGGVLRPFHPADEGRHAVDEQPRRPPLEAAPGRPAAADASGVLTRLLRDAGARAAAEALLGSDGDGEGGEGGDGRGVWAREWRAGDGW
ncbi:uncharacterized protein LOC135633230 isoform X2 [Musa acuminata AAA Group]|uniref:uncharacterized protein LOC135633230 isoform X2 n=1 Tax=Musa acuminata AAA Group TaxID=214697 RepID=UPI0031E2D314